MKYHPIRSGIQCPFCGKLKFVYKRPGLSGDVYRCAAELGGCERTIVHRRRKGDLKCGVAAVLNFGYFGPWDPCAPAGEPRGAAGLLKSKCNDAA